MGKYITLAVIGAVLLLGLTLLLGWFGFSNGANAFETDIKSTYSNNQNIFDNGWKKVAQVAEVPDMYRDDMMKVWQGALTGRYGEKGSQAVMQFIQEQNPQLDSELYKKVQRVIEGFRDDFAANQTKLVSVKQAYGRYLTSNTNSRFYNMFSHYPHIQCGEICGASGEDKYAIVTSDRTEDIFKTHKEELQPLRKKGQ